MQVLLNRKEDLELDKRVDALYVFVSVFTARYQLLRGEIEAPKPVIAMEIVQPKPAPLPVKPKETEPAKVATEKPAPARKRRAAVLTDEEKSYYLYNACRSFPGEVFRKHINLSLIHKRSTGGLIILRPHQCKKTAATNSQSFLTQVFSNLHENGNHGRVRGKAPAQPFLSRNLPSEAQLQDQTVLTPEIRVIRGPGRPYGSFSSKKSAKRGSKAEKTTKTTKKARASKKTPLLELPPLPTQDLEINRDSDEDAFEKEGPALTLKQSEMASMMNMFDINSLLQPKWSCLLTNSSSGSSATDSARAPHTRESPSDHRPGAEADPSPRRPCT